MSAKAYFKRVYFVGTGLFVLLLCSAAIVLNAFPDAIADRLLAQPALLPVGGAVVLAPLVVMAVLLLIAPKTFVSDQRRMTAAGQVAFIRALCALLVLVSILCVFVLWRLARTFAGVA